jgi:hypothetical protein
MVCVTISVHRSYDYLIKEITKHKSATNSARAREIIPGVNMLLAASGFLEIPVIHADPMKPIARAAADPHTPKVRANKFKVVVAAVASII